MLGFDWAVKKLIYEFLNSVIIFYQTRPKTSASGYLVTSPFAIFEQKYTKL